MKHSPEVDGRSLLKRVLPCRDVQETTLPLAASQTVFNPRLRAMLPIQEVRAASKPIWMEALGVLRLRMQEIKLFTLSSVPSCSERAKISGSGAWVPGEFRTPSG